MVLLAKSHMCRIAAEISAIADDIEKANELRLEKSVEVGLRITEFVLGLSFWKVYVRTRERHQRALPPSPSRKTTRRIRI
jgi:hypothetical protein